jgi:hypothetical protein
MADEPIVSGAATEIAGAAEASAAARERGAEQTAGGAAPGSILGDTKAGEATPEGEQEGVETKEAGEQGEKKPDIRAPEEYGDFAVPEGMKLEGQELSDFQSFAKEQDLTQEQAQKVLDFAGPKIKAMIEQPYKAWQELTRQWWDQTKADSEVGGTKLEQSAKEAGQAFVPGEANPFFKTESEVMAIREALKITGAMHHPEVQRLFLRMGKLLAEPGNFTGRPAPQNKQDALLKSMYPTMSDGDQP